MKTAATSSLALLALLSACSGTDEVSSSSASLTRWESDELVATADADYLYFRFSLPSDQETVQAAPRTVALYLDTDASAQSGRTSPYVPFNEMGVDLEVQFSPKPEGQGVAILAVAADGSTTKVPGDDTELCLTPNFASRTYEGRISRHFWARRLAAATGSDVLTGVVVQLDEGGQIEGYSDPFRVELPSLSDEFPYASVDLPEKPEGAIRVVSYNVHKSAPAQSPEPFGRVLQVLKPDVVLVQEWDEGDEQELARWFTSMVSPSQTWHARKAGEIGIVSLAPLSALPPDKIELVDASNQTRVVRYAAARAEFPQGALVLAGVHLKCCGTARGPEELTRRLEAGAINATLGAAVKAHPPAAMILAGDLNLVGTRTPLDVLGRGLDVDASDLEVASPKVLGDNTAATWSDWSTGFPPARLDYVLYSGEAAKILQAFVLDTSVLSEESLAKLGLSRSDTDASDHKPVVVDLELLDLPEAPAETPAEEPQEPAAEPEPEPAVTP